MIEHEYRDFAAMLSDTLELYGRKLSDGAANMWWRLLQQYDFADVMCAFERYATDPEQGKFPPTPAAIIGCLPTDPTTAQLTADEAWAIALQTFDESASVCVNDQIVAACAVARPIYLEGDKVGARMAFKSAYERVTAATRGMTPRWYLSIGHDAAGRATAAEDALKRGLLTKQQVAYLLPLKPAEINQENLARVRGLIAGTVAASTSSNPLPPPTEYDLQLAEIRARAQRNGVKSWTPADGSTDDARPDPQSDPQSAANLQRMKAMVAETAAAAKAKQEADRAAREAEQAAERERLAQCRADQRERFREWAIAHGLDADTALPPSVLESSQPVNSHQFATV